MNNRNIVLIGGGNQAQYSIDIIERAGVYDIVGIIDSRREIGSDVFGYKVIGRQEQIQLLMKEYDISGGLITIGDNWGRCNVSEEIRRS